MAKPPTVAWARLSGTPFWDSSATVSTGLEGSIYIAGYSWGSLDGQINSGNHDAYLSKYAPDGSKSWTRLVGSAGFEDVRQISASPDGSIYVVGATSGNLDGQVNKGDDDGFVTKFNAEGTKAWTRLIGSLGQDHAQAVSVGKDGFIYVSGNTNSANLDGQINNGGFDGFISKYSSTGDKIWTRLLDGASDDMAHNIATGIDGAIYITGNTRSSFSGQYNGGDWDVQVSKYSADGSKQWTSLLASTGADYTGGIATGADGSVYVVGDTWGALGGQGNAGLNDAYLTKFNPDGSKAWTKQRGTSGWDACVGVTVGTDGCIYVSGSTEGSLDGQTPIGGRDAYVTKYKSDGTLLWTKLLGTSSWDYATDVTLGANGTIYVTGDTEGSFYSQTNSGGKDAFLIKLYEPSAYAKENSTAVTLIPVTDHLLGTAPRYTLSGLDASLFKISTKGALTFAVAKDYEQPVDTNKDGIYEVTVTLTNAKTGYRVVKDLTVGVEFTPILGTANADALKGTTGYDTLDGQGGDDKLTGGAGLDTFVVTSGRDTVLDFNLLTKGATGSEILQVSAGATADATLKAAWAATADSFNVGTANIVTSGLAVDLSAVTQGQGWNVTNKGVATTMTGSLFNDVLTGGTGNDQINGGAGDDLLIGGKGYDILTGGTGADTFRLSGDTKTDHITDFLSGTDRIELDNALFKALLIEGQLAANQFAKGTAATTTAQRIVYDQPTGNLWYDLDGSGKGKAVLVAVLDNHVQVANTDFWVI